MLCCSIMQNVLFVRCNSVNVYCLLCICDALINKIKQKNINTSLLNVITFSVKPPGMVFQCDG